MSSAVLEEILEVAEEAKALPPGEQQQLREALSDEKLMGSVGVLLLAFGLLHVLERINALPRGTLLQFYDTLNREAAEAGLIDRTSAVRAVRGKYAHLRVSSEEFAAQKREEVKLEDRR